MNPNKINNNSTENLTRRQKLLRRVGAPLAAIAALGAIHHGVSQGESPEPSDHSSAETVVATATVQFGGEAEGWGHGTATNAIEEAITEGAAVALDEAGAPAETNIQAIVDELPTYNQANQVLDMADEKTEVVPDSGDKLKVTVEVTADNDANVSYEVIDAETQDLRNNQ